MIMELATPLRRKSWYLNWLNLAIRLLQFFGFVFLAFSVYELLLRTILTKEIHFFTYVAFWLFTAYIVLPWLHRRVSRLYLPDYFIGRARTGDGLLGDPINLALHGSRHNVIAAMEQAGWVQATELNYRSSLKMLVTGFAGKSYPDAPVSSLFLFGKKQDLAFEREVNNNPRRRHHVRFWKTPAGWHLPGGSQADWLGAATYDRNVGLSLFTGQITHKINANVDAERDYVLATLHDSRLVKNVEIVQHFTDSYHARSGGGDRITTDGALPFVTISGRPAHHGPQIKKQTRLPQASHAN